MKKLCMTMLALCAAVSAAFGANYYLKSGATDLSVAASYTTGSAGGSDAATPPGSSDEVWIPAGTFAIAGTSASFTTLSGVKRVRPNDGAILEFTIADNDTCTFNAPINYNGGERYDDESHIKCYGKVIKKGAGTLILEACGKTKSNSGNLRQDYFTQIELQQGTLKFPQHAEGAMYFGDVAMSDGTTLVTCGNVTNSSLGTATYVRSINGYGTVTNESARSTQSFSPFERNEVYANEFHGKICAPAILWLDGRFVHYGHEAGASKLLTVQNNNGHLNDGYDRGVYSFEDAALLGSVSQIQFYSNGGGLHYFGAGDAEIDKSVYFYTYEYPAFIDAGWHGGLTFSGGFYVNAVNSISTVSKWLVLTGSNAVPCNITGSFVDSNFSGKTWEVPTLQTIFTQKLGSGTWRFKGSRNHGGGFAIEEGTLQFDSIDEKGMACSLGLSTNLTAACSARNPEHVDYAFSLGSTTPSAPDAVFEYMGALAAKCTTRPLVLVGKGGSLSASNGRLAFGGVLARDANATPTLTLAGTGSVVNVVRDISDGATGAKVSVTKEDRGSWALAGNQTFTGDITVKQGNLAIRAPVSGQYADYKWFRLSIAQIGAGSENRLQIRQICLFDKDGVRQNADLEMAGPSASVTGSIDASSPPAVDIGPGQVYYDRSAIGHKVSLVGRSYGDLGQAFDGYFSGSVGGRYCINWYSSTGAACCPSPSDRSTWIPIVMHLSDSANPVTHFDIEGFADTAATLPTRILLEGSHNGLEWAEVYSNVDASKTLLAQSNNYFNQWISDGTSGDDNKNRPLGDGLTLSKSGDVDLHRYFSWFRLSIAKLGDNSNNSNSSDDNYWNVRQIGLYDKYGNRLNSGLKMAEGPTTINNETRTILGTVPKAGEVGYDVSAAGLRVTSVNAGELELCFDDTYSGNEAGRTTLKWYSTSGEALPPDPVNRKTWIPIVMHLESAVELDHFDIETMNNNNLQSPRRLMLEGSVDGVDWYVLYDNATTGEENSIEPASYNWWLSDGVSATKTDYARLADTGFAVSTPHVPDEVVAQFPDGMSVQVLSGATLTAENDTQTIKTLKVDSVGAGTIDGFTFAENGTIDVTNPPENSSFLPGTYVNCSGLENVSGWALKVDGKANAKCKVSARDGRLYFARPGFVLMYR